MTRPTVQYLRECMREKEGRVFWLTRPLEHFKCLQSFRAWNTKYANMEAGCFEKKKTGIRCVINFNGVTIYRYHVVWALNHGEWAPGEIDHEDRDSSHDHIDNLRLATSSQNHANSRIRSNNTSGYKGVTWSSVQNKWQAQISVNNHLMYLGCFEDIDEAKRVYDAAAIRYFGEFAFAG